MWQNAPVTPGSRNIGGGLWRLADPKICLASMASIFLGACAAGADGPLHAGWLAATILGIFCLEVAKNASGEIFDFDSGADAAVAPEDRSPFSGGKRVLVDGLLSRPQTAAIAAAAYLLGAGTGLAIVWGREPRVVWLGLVGAACAYFYGAPPVRLSYRGLGETAVAACYGPLICGGTYLVQRGSLTPQVVWLSLPLGLLIAGFLWINEFPDTRADRVAGKRTLVVRLGPRRASVAFAAIEATAFIALVALPLCGLPRTVWLAALGIPPAVLAARRLLRHPESTPDLIPAQTATLLAFLLFALGAGAGLLAHAAYG